MEQTACLILENGMVFYGKRFGASGETVGELVFTTGMTGYLETLTDPSYYGQIVMQTFPLIGNYGVIPADFESGNSHMRAYIVREQCQEPSNFRCEGTLDTFLKQQNMIGLCGIDTRALTRIVREAGVMNAKIADNDDCLEEVIKELKNYRVKDAVASVSPAQRQEWLPDGKPQRHVVLWDFGAKGNIEKELVKRGARVTGVPYNTTAEEILALQPDGIMLSNGPGDPSENVAIAEEIRKLLPKGIPMFGICLGHQMLALAHGAQTIKLKYGHRGANQPVTDTVTGRVYITSQNHGYAVKSDTLPFDAKERFVNGNDGTCEGIDYGEPQIFSVQFHPEACGGPLDTGFLFDRFFEMMKGGADHAAE